MKRFYTSGAQGHRFGWIALAVVAGAGAAGAGARVLLLSDRNVPPRRGLTAAHVLESLGASMTWDPTEAEDWVARTRFGACAVSGFRP